MPGFGPDLLSLSGTREATLAKVGFWEDRTFELPSGNDRFVPRSGIRARRQPNISGLPRAVAGTPCNAEVGPSPVGRLPLGDAPSVADCGLETRHGKHTLYHLMCDKMQQLNQAAIIDSRLQLALIFTSRSSVDGRQMPEPICRAALLPVRTERSVRSQQWQRTAAGVVVLWSFTRRSTRNLTGSDVASSGI